MSVSVEDIAKQMLVLMPEDGTPVLNRVMRVTLARALSTGIDEDRYLAARGEPVDRGQIELFLDEWLRDAPRTHVRSLLNGVPA